MAEYGILTHDVELDEGLKKGCLVEITPYDVDPYFKVRLATPGKSEPWCDTWWDTINSWEFEKLTPLADYLEDGGDPKGLEVICIDGGGYANFSIGGRYEIVEKFEEGMAKVRLKGIGNAWTERFVVAPEGGGEVEPEEPQKDPVEISAGDRVKCVDASTTFGASGDHLEEGETYWVISRHLDYLRIIDNEQDIISASVDRFELDQSIEDWGPDLTSLSNSIEYFEKAAQKCRMEEASVLAQFLMELFPGAASALHFIEQFNRFEDAQLYLDDLLSDRPKWEGLSDSLERTFELVPEILWAAVRISSKGADGASAAGERFALDLCPYDPSYEWAPGLAMDKSVLADNLGVTSVKVGKLFGETSWSNKLGYQYYLK